MKKELDHDRMIDYTHNLIQLQVNDSQDRPSIIRGLSSLSTPDNDSIPEHVSTNRPPHHNTTPPQTNPSTHQSSPAIQHGSEILNPNFIYVEASGDTIPIDDYHIATAKAHFPDCQHYMNGVSIRLGRHVITILINR